MTELETMMEKLIALHGLSDVLSAVQASVNAKIDVSEDDDEIQALESISENLNDCVNTQDEYTDSL